MKAVGQIGLALAASILAAAPAVSVAQVPAGQSVAQRLSLKQANIRRAGKPSKGSNQIIAGPLLFLAIAAGATATFIVVKQVVDNDKSG